MNKLKIRDELKARDDKSEVKNIKSEIEDASRLRFKS